MDTKPQMTIALATFRAIEHICVKLTYFLFFPQPLCLLICSFFASSQCIHSLQSLDSNFTCQRSRISPHTGDSLPSCALCWKATETYISDWFHIIRAKRSKIDSEKSFLHGSSLSIHFTDQKDSVHEGVVMRTSAWWIKVETLEAFLKKTPQSISGDDTNLGFYRHQRVTFWKCKYLKKKS